MSKEQIRKANKELQNMQKAFDATWSRIEKHVSTIEALIVDAKSAARK